MLTDRLGGHSIHDPTRVLHVGEQDPPPDRRRGSEGCDAVCDEWRQLSSVSPLSYGSADARFAFWGIVLYPVPDAETLFRKGTIAMFVVSGLLALWIVVVWYLEKWVVRRVPPPKEEPAIEIEIPGKDSDLSIAKV